MSDYLIAGARLADGRTTDLHLRDGSVLTDQRPVGGR